MEPLPGEEWLSTTEPVLRGWLSKAILSFVAIGGPLLLILSEAPILLKLAGSTVWVLAMLALWLLSWLAIYRAKVRSLEDEKVALIETPKGDVDYFSDLQHSLMDMMYDYYPQRYMREELEAKSGRKRVEIDTALFSLSRRVPRLVGEPKGGLWHDGQPNPKGWWLSVLGMTYQEKRRSEQAAAGQPLLAPLSPTL